MELHYYDRYFGIKYPMAKLDMVGDSGLRGGRDGELRLHHVSRDGDAGGRRRTARSPAKKEVASTVAHEMAHQWFGDMVTMQWWDNLWLNEGFATWMETKAAAQWKPEWKFEQDVAVELDGTMELDAQATTRAIRTRGGDAGGDRRDF